MFKKLFTAIIIVSMTLVLVPACAEQDKDAVAVAGETQSTETPVSTPAAETTKPEMTSDGAQVSVMDLPVNFSTPKMLKKASKMSGNKRVQPRPLNLPTRWDTYWPMI